MRVLVTGGSDGNARLWDITNGKLVRSFGQHRARVSCLAFSKDGKRFLAGEDRLVHLFDTE